ncbi:MAG: hypothetical protein LBT26_00500 [Clostridiales Family XIII bacterium]|jgi:maleate isomerase|nr:hypothetical protein [Clostridiales Family XIII bacterium]
MNGMNASLKSKPRVGLIVPSVQSVTEPLFNKIHGDSFDFLTARVRLTGGKIEHLIAMEKTIPDAVMSLVEADVDRLVYCCTASGAISGKEHEMALSHEIQREFHVPVLTTMMSCLEAFKSISANSVAIVAPNIAPINDKEREYIEQNGFRVLSDAGFNMEDGRLFSFIPTEEIEAFALKHWNDQADVLFMSCMNWQATKVMFEVQDRIGKPVVTSHAATLWQIYCTLKEETGYLDYLALIQDKVKKS